MNDEAVYRTAPATPGLLITMKQGISGEQQDSSPHPIGESVHKGNDLKLHKNALFVALQCIAMHCNGTNRVKIPKNMKTHTPKIS